MAADETSSDRRKEHRTKVKITVLLKMGVLLNGRGLAKDISRNGMRLVSPQLDKFWAPRGGEPVIARLRNPEILESLVGAGVAYR